MCYDDTLDPEITLVDSTQYESSSGTTQSRLEGPGTSPDPTQLGSRLDPPWRLKNIEVRPQRTAEVLLIQSVSIEETFYPTYTVQSRLHSERERGRNPNPIVWAYIRVIRHHAICFRCLKNPSLGFKKSRKNKRGKKFRKWSY